MPIYEFGCQKCDYTVEKLFLSTNRYEKSVSIIEDSKTGLEMKILNDEFCLSHEKKENLVQIISPGTFYMDGDETESLRRLRRMREDGAAKEK